MDDKLKQRLMVGVVGFNLSVIIYMVFKYFTHDKPNIVFGDVTGWFGVAAVIGVVVGGIAAGASIVLGK